MSREFNSCFCLFICLFVCLFICCFFLWVFSGKDLWKTLSRDSTPVRGMVFVSANVFCGNPPMPLSLSLCLFVCLSLSVYVTLTGQKRAYLSPENQSNVEPNGFSWSVEHEKLCERASHDCLSDWMTKWVEFV